MIDALKRAWTNAFNQTTKEKYVLGRLGSVDPVSNTVTFDAPGRPGYTLVRIVSGSDQGTTIAAYNQGVALKYDAPVKIYYDPTDGQPKIVGVDPVLAQAYAGPSGVPLSGVAPHTHTLNSGLEYYEDARLILTGLCIPNSGLTITVQAFKYQYNGIRATYGGLPTLDLSTYMTVSSGEHQWVLIGVDPSTNLIDVEVSAGVPVAVPLTDADLDGITFTNKIPLAAVQLTFGLTSGATFQSDFTDCRVWNTGIGGTSPAAITALANGGTGSDLSATGPGYAIQASNAANFTILKNNLTAVIAPVVGNDNTQGYAIGSQWIDTVAKVEYVCLNASTGAAVWKSTSTSGAGDVVGPASAIGDDFVQFDSTSGKLIKDGGLSRTIDGTLAANSDVLIPSEKAVKTYVDASAPSYPIAVNKGGTHLATLTDKALIVGAGTSDPTFLSPGTNRNVAISDGTNWTSRALVSADIPSLSYAPTNASYITSIAESSLSNEFALASLATGILKNTTTTGIPTIAVAGTDYTSPTGIETLTNKTLTTPTIGDFTNANHNHQNAAGGGSLDAAAIGSGTLNNARVNWAAPGTLGSTTPNTIAGTTYTGTGLSTITITDSGTSTTVNAMTIGHNSSGTPTTNIASAYAANVATATVTDRLAGFIEFGWRNSLATDATRFSSIRFYAQNSSGNQLSLEVGVNASGKTIGFLGNTAVNQQTNVTGVDTGLRNFGLWASGGNSPFDLLVQFKAGTTGTEPVRFRAGVLVTTPSAGAMEYVSNSFWYTVTKNTQRFFMPGRVAAISGTVDGFGTVALTAQTASIAATNIIATANMINDGEYMAIVVLTDTTASTSGGTVLASILYTDENGAQTQSTATLVLSATGYTTSTLVFHAKTSAGIQYSTTVGGVIVGSPTYSLYIDLIRLS